MDFKKAEQYFANILISLLMLLIYALFAMHFLPEGINQVFATWLWKRILILLAVFYFCFFLFILFKKDKSFSYLKKIDKIEWQELLLLLLPITPIVQYIILNHEILPIADSCFVISFFAVLILIFGYAVPWMLSVIASKEFLMILALCFLFVIFNMALLAPSFKWHLSGDPLIQSSILLAAITVILCVRIAGKNFLYIVIGVRNQII